MLALQCIKKIWGREGGGGGGGEEERGEEGSSKHVNSLQNMTSPYKTHILYSFKIISFLISRYILHATSCLLDISYYHLVDMNTSIPLVESQVIWKRITGFKSNNILKCAFKAKTPKVQCAWCVWRACVSKSVAQIILKQVVRSHITCLITVIQKIIHLIVFQCKCCKFVTEMLSIWFMNKIGIFFRFFNIKIHVYQVIKSLSPVCTQYGKYLWMGAVLHSAYGLMWYSTHP